LVLLDDISRERGHVLANRTLPSGLGAVDSKEGAEVEALNVLAVLSPDRSPNSQERDWAVHGHLDRGPNHFNFVVILL